MFFTSQLPNSLEKAFPREFGRKAAFPAAVPAAGAGPCPVPLPPQPAALPDPGSPRSCSRGNAAIQARTHLGGAVFPVLSRIPGGSRVDPGRAGPPRMRSERFPQSRRWDARENGNRSPSQNLHFVTLPSHPAPLQLLLL